MHARHSSFPPDNAEMRTGCASGRLYEDFPTASYFDPPAGKNSDFEITRLSAAACDLMTPLPVLHRNVT